MGTRTRTQRLSTCSLLRLKYRLRAPAVAARTISLTLPSCLCANLFILARSAGADQASFLRPVNGAFKLVFESGSKNALLNANMNCIKNRMLVESVSRKPLVCLAGLVETAAEGESFFVGTVIDSSTRIKAIPSPMQ